MLTNIQYKSCYSEEDRPKEMSWDKFLSRKALSILCKKKPNEIEIINHLHLKDSPNTLVSLSHTKEFAIAVISNCPETMSIGVDMEKKDRIIKEGYEKFFLNDSDDYESLLKLWCQKEAAYKAIWPLIGDKITFNKTFVLKDIWVKAQKFGLMNDSVALGNFENILHDQLIIVTAKISIPI